MAVGRGEAEKGCGEVERGDTTRTVEAGMSKIVSPIVDEVWGARSGPGRKDQRSVKEMTLGNFSAVFRRG